jgi:hypothetical protein
MADVSRRARAASLQLAVFLCGGVLGPVWHNASHRPDHSHGPDGASIAFHVHQNSEAHAHEPAPVAPKTRARAEITVPEAHGHPHVRGHHGHGHTDGHGHGHSGPRAHRHGRGPVHVHEPEEPSRPPAPKRPAPRASEQASGAGSSPLEHGHGSLAHFGLALLGAPPLVALPAPEPRPELAVGASLAPRSLFQPSFPLPRPPPALA